MIATEKGRYCNACAKTVVDFSTMNDTELLNYFNQSKSQNVCGRVYPDQLDRIIRLPARPRKKIWVYWQYMLALFLFTGKGSVAKAQGKVSTETCVPAKQDMSSQHIMVGGISAASRENRTAIFLQVTDEAGNAIPFASAKLLPGGTGAVADSLGRLKLKNLNTIESILVSAIGYEAREIKINELSGPIITMKLNTEAMGEIVLVGDSRISGKMRMGAVSSTCSISIFDSIKKFTNPFTSQLQVYPNPATRDGLITLVFNMSMPGNYNVQLTNSAGQVLMIQQYNTAATSVTQQVPIPAEWDAGICFITILDTKGKRIGTQKFIIE